MIKRITILVLFGVFALSSCNKNACFECSKAGSTRGMCGEDARDFKRDMEKQGYSCNKVRK